MARSLFRRLTLNRYALLLCALGTCGFTSALAQESTDNQSVSMRRMSLDPVGDSAVSIQAQRERLFNELAEEFNTFDRLGHLVRRVSMLVKPSVIHIEAHKTEVKAGSRQAYDEAGSGVVVTAADGNTWVLTNRHVIAGADPGEIRLRSS